MSQLLDLSKVRIVDLSMTIEPHWRFQPVVLGQGASQTTVHLPLHHPHDGGAHGFSHADALFGMSRIRLMDTIDMMPLTDFFGPSALVDVSDSATTPN